ncbi:lipase family protein [Amycolatopsis mongoliensis]|uniref:Lipase family protein n=1 Tax=Amycolatopsis mongoliensis TaxID=715475 RepID=A0A9Y2JZ49_9PSEU|nr:lipase family protein [Amycolatopsis sp. 4-36]WIY07378.1 lipase family protein [Amycolatopsis sp. 4-36]
MLRRLLVAVSLIFAVATPVAHADPGVLVSARATTVFVGPLPAPVKAWHLLYRSTSATGAPNEVSGTLLVPSAPWPRGGPRPLVTYAVGTHGLGDQCAPSTLLAHGVENESALLAQALSQGWAVVVTDYEGLGTPGTHTYAVGQSEGRAVLDAARAAALVPGAGLSPSGPVGVFGYSQGGQAAAWAAELQGSYAPSLRVVGVAAGGVPADLNAVFRSNDGGAAFGLVLGAATGFAAAYPDVPFSSILNDRGREAVARVSKACTVELGAAAPFAHLRDFVTVPDPIHDPRWQARLAQNYLGTVAPSAPVFLYHATLDELIPFSVGAGLRDRWKSAGASVTWQEFPLLEHIGGVSAGGPVALTWLGTKF